ncbi:hypothetical protein PoB_005144500 [Plakobranchus ocellatus]|uniref:Uncharacterized protein n=1 Tax=Plakobranchus ocellatus TaxID=259542 RepID=A0AAV4BWZ7_9GAST|nr:hypothetical protein PoB_005144500 [Plakobranchus ocellatus]
MTSSSIISRPSQGVPPRRRMRVEISQHKKRLRKLLKDFSQRKFRNWGIGRQIQRANGWSLFQANCGSCSMQASFQIYFRKTGSVSDEESHLAPGDPPCRRSRV